MNLIKNIKNAWDGFFEKQKTPYVLTKDQEDIAVQQALQVLRSAKPYLTLDLAIKNGLIDIRAEHDRYNVIIYHKKMQPIWDAEKKEREEKERKALLAKYDYRYMYSLIEKHFKSKGHKFDYINESDSYKKYIQILCYLMAGHNERLSQIDLKNGKYDPKKGLLVIGGYGVGKTAPIQALLNNPINPIMFFSLKQIAGMVKENGKFSYDTNHTHKYYFDDLGSENVVNNYGTKIDWWADDVEKNYLYHLLWPRIITTSNLDMQDIEQKYGERASSRMNEMFNIHRIDGIGNRRLNG